MSGSGAWTLISTTETPSTRVRDALTFSEYAAGRAASTSTRVRATPASSEDPCSAAWRARSPAESTSGLRTCHAKANCKIAADKRATRELTNTHSAIAEPRSRSEDSIDCSVEHTGQCLPSKRPDQDHQARSHDDDHHPTRDVSAFQIPGCAPFEPRS